MKLVAYYSRTGTAKKIAEIISKALKCDIEEIVDLKNRKGVLGFLKSGRDAATGRDTKIKTKKDPSKYDLIVVGGPIWAGTITPAVRTYLKQNKIKKLAFFCTKGGGEIVKAIKEVKKLSGKKPKAFLELTTKEVKQNNYKEKLNNFISKIKN